MKQKLIYRSTLCIFLLTGIVQTFAQEFDYVKISVQWSNATLDEVFKSIEQQTDLRFAYDKTLLETPGDITLTCVDRPLKDVLKDVEDNFSVEFRQINKTISVKGKKPLATIRVGNPLTIAVRGRVTDSQTGEAIIGVNILLQRANGNNSSPKGTTTDVDGNFLVELLEGNNILIFSAIGYVTQEIETNNRTNIDVALSPETTELETIVVVGYSSQAATDITGSVGIVNITDVKKIAVNGIDQALKGQVAGVQVTNDGQPGGNASVRIRGYSTIGDNDPLYIVDGIPTKQHLNQFAANDIASIQVLKDASATAIYGSRATNGVVIITTKKGTGDKTIVTLDSYMGIQQAMRLPTMLNTQQYADMLWKAEKNSGKSPSNDVFGNGPEPVIPDFIEPGIIQSSIPGTDWFHEVFKTATMQSHSLSVQGGGKNVRNMTSMSYMNQQGTMVYTGFDRYNIRTNTEVDLGPIKIGENLSISYASVRSVPTNQALGSRMIHTYRINPIVPVKDVNGNWAGPVSGVDGALNPVAMNFLDRNDRNATTRIFGNVFGEAKLLKDFALRSTLGVDYSVQAVKDYNPKYKMGINERAETSFLQSQSTNFQLIWNNTLQYTKHFDRHYVSALVGSEIISFKGNSFGTSRSGYISDDIQYIQLSSGTGTPSNFGSATAWALFSTFARVEYEFNDRYLATVSARRDGSSRFGKSNRYAVFPAFSIGWRLSSEDFLKGSSFIDDMKLRVSWGQTGNQEVGDFATFSSFSSSVWNSYYDINGANDDAEMGFKATRIGNSDLKWETTTQANIGLDISFLKSVSLSVDYFIKDTKDILIQRPTLAVEGQAEAPYVNIGKMQNKGIEITASYKKSLANKISFHVNANASIIRNKVVALSSDVEYLTGLVSDTYSRGVVLSRTTVGLPIAQFYGYVTEGIFRSQEEVANHAQQTGKGIGRIKYKDLNDDKVIDEKDQQTIGNPHPKMMYGLNVGAGYRNFDLSIFFQGIQGVDIYNFTRYYTDFYYDLSNRHTRILDSWTPQNPNAKIPMVAAIDVNNELRPSTYFVEDGSFLRCKSAEIGYTINFKNSNNKTMRIYARGYNLFTVTPYQGIDPEVGLVNYDNSNRNLDIGVDRGIYPNSRTIMLGFNLKL